MINVGIIGCGKIALTRHLPEYSQRQDCRVAAVYDPNIERAKKYRFNLSCKSLHLC